MPTIGTINGVITEAIGVMDMCAGNKAEYAFFDNLTGK